MQAVVHGVGRQRAGRQRAAWRACALLALLALLALGPTALSTGCGPGGEEDGEDGGEVMPPPDPRDPELDPRVAAQLYVDDAHARRVAMEASVAVAADTRYATLRMAHYARGAAEGLPDDPSIVDWDTLPEYAPRVRPLRVRGATTSGEAGAAIADLSRLGPDASLATWEEVGAEVYLRMPTQIDLGLYPLRERATAEAAGFVVREDGVVETVVEVETSTGWVPALTCASCHSTVRDGVRVLGPGNERIDFAVLGGASWPRGTMDVTPDGIDNPVRPSDLRPISRQERLHHTGSVANGRIARMVRIETLIITQRNARLRPDRRAIAALSLFMDRMADALPELDRASAGGQRFAEVCGSCHRGEWLAGDVVPLSVVGTEDSATRPGSERATGGYRAPSLRGVGQRRGLFHDGSAEDLDAVLGLRESTHAGHRFAEGLSEDERRAIAAFLRAE